MLDTRWDLAEDRYALGLSANDADQFQGFHCENMLVVVDEAEGVAESIYEAVEAVMTSAKPTLLLIGNPTTSSGGFHRAFHRERGIYETITISALESPNVEEGSIVIPGLTTPAWVEERRKMWGEGSAMFRARVLGEFPDRGEDNLISVSTTSRTPRSIRPAKFRPARFRPARFRPARFRPARFRRTRAGANRRWSAWTWRGSAPTAP